MREPKNQMLGTMEPPLMQLSVKDYRYHAFPNTEFSYFLTIDTRQYERPNYLLKIGGHRPLKGCYDVICNDVICH